MKVSVKAAAAYLVFTGIY